jgi:reductive dehalogenase
MIQTAGRMFGCLSVGVMEIDADTKKLLYSWEPGGREQLTWEGNEPVETSSEHRHPVNAKYVISITDQESQELWKRNPTSLMTQIRYERASQIQFRFQTFLRKLGYVCLSEGGNGTGIAGAIAVMAGQGETGRHNRLITPEYGPTVGVFRYVTDLPLAPTKPIDSGLWEFCKACKKCAEACGGDAIPYGDPTWDITENTTPWLEGAAPVDRPGAYKDALGNPELRQGGWHAVGHEQYPEDSRKCRLWKMSAGTCRSGRCLAVCTFTKYNEAGIHEVVKGITATTSVFNGFFRTLDDAFGYGLRGRRHDDFSDNETADQAQADWWNLDLPIYGIDSTIGAGRIS